MKYFLIIALFFSSCKQPHKVAVMGTVVEKASGYNRNTSTFEYHTLIKTDDGYIEDMKGLRYYALKIDTRVMIEVYR